MSPSASRASFRSSSARRWISSRRGAAVCATGWSATSASGGAAPECERAGEILLGLARPALCERPGRALDEPLEPIGVELVRLEADAVAVAVRLDPLGSEGAAQAVHVDLERARGLAGRRLSPEGVDEMLSGHDGAAVQEQLGEESALLRAAERERTPVDDGLHRPEQAEFQLFDPLQTTASGS